ncbi:MAG TPA: glycosyltransferase family 1 protein [Vicinamibacterales bacterium]|nr:glycosyltransferase family 1 protein [Vicinamibacterales bacterium]
MRAPVHIVFDYRPALRERTGVGEYVHQLARALAALARDETGDRVVLFSSSWKDRLPTAPEFEAPVEIVDRRIPVRLLNYLWHRREWPPLERLVPGPIDVAHSAHPLLSPSSSLRAVTIHDLDFLAHPDRTRGEIRRDYPALVRDHARRADLVVVSSRFGAGEVARELGVEPARIVICPAGAPAWPPRPADQTDGYVLFVGALAPRKDLGTLLRAYARLIPHLPMPDLVLAGPATPAAGEWLAALTRPPLVGRARHIGYVPAAERPALYRGARLVVLPSWHEGFGLPALEAMASGVPLIASRVGALPEVAGEAALYVRPGDEGALAAAIRTVLTSPVQAAAMREAGLRRAAGFRWADSARVLRAAYAEALARRSPHARGH